MYEMDFTGWTRTPEDLKHLETNKAYRRRCNFNRLVKSVKYGKGDFIYYLNCWLFNRNDF